MKDTELEAYLDGIGLDDEYEVVEVIKESPAEVTQLVRRRGGEGTPELLIRKYLAADSGLGQAYLRLCDATLRGVRLGHVPHVFDCHSDGEHLVVLMERVVGVTLEELVVARGGSMQTARDVFPAICDAVDEIHRKFNPPIIHRDLKPSNIMFDGNRAIIIDFGIARELRSDADADTHQFGTRAFAPPEQYGFGQTTVRSDVYALGMVLWFCLTGEMPGPKTRDSISLDKRVVQPLRDVVWRAVALDPLDRFASAREMRAAFLDACEAAEDEPDPIVTPPAVKPEVSSPETSQQPGCVDPIGKLWNAFLLLAFIVIVGVSLSSISSPTPDMLDNPHWYNVVTRGIIIPVFFVGAGFALMDKRRLRARHPWLRWAKWWVAPLLFAALFVVLSICVYYLNVAAGLR